MSKERKEGRDQLMRNSNRIEWRGKEGGREMGENECGEGKRKEGRKQSW